MTPKIKLTYFEMFGRAGAVRLALAVGGIDFEDERLSPEEFVAKKAAGEFPFGSVPVMEVDGLMLAETIALLRFAGKLSGLYPEDPLDAAKVDMVIDGVENLFGPATSDSSPEAREKFEKEILPRYVKPVDEILAKSKSGPFVLGEKMTIADLWLASYVGFLSSGKLEHVSKDCFNSYSYVLAAAKAVGEKESVAAWMKEHEKE